MSVIVLSVLSILLAICCAVFAWLFFSLKSKIKDNPNFETQLIISDMLRGNAIVRISRVAPEDIYLRRQ